jgi:hypothetical protein
MLIKRPVGEPQLAVVGTSADSRDHCKVLEGGLAGNVSCLGNQLSAEASVLRSHPVPMSEGRQMPVDMDFANHGTPPYLLDRTAAVG